jgi:phospholipid N-methyltransferase
MDMNVAPDQIFHVACGFMAAKHLFMANAVGVFEKLADGPATLDELANRVGVPDRTTRIIADSMVALGFLEKENGRYKNSRIAATFLSGETPADLRPFLKFWDRLSYPRWVELEQAIRTGEAVLGELEFNEEEQEIYSEGVEAIQSGPAQAFAASYDFDKHERLLDLGGGTGSWLRAVLTNHEHLQGTLFELPQVAEIARQVHAKAPYADRLDVVAGDIFADAIPGGHDAVLIANIFHNFTPDKNLALLAKLREGFPKNGKLLLVDLWTNSLGTEPLMGALMAAEFLVHSGGDTYREKDCVEWLSETSWRLLSFSLWPDQ